ncbi:MAG: hypothetical protein JST01_06385, partial [Cyanobacteria bacterium SZAS TMP-1]|nr:hypothetical protein [Cyanobacteria bacterium SZAS TMP-1]
LVVLPVLAVLPVLVVLPETAVPAAQLVPVVQAVLPARPSSVAKAKITEQQKKKALALPARAFSFAFIPDRISPASEFPANEY